MRNLWTDPTTLTVSCARGIMPYLQDEVKALGYTILGATDTMLGIQSKNAARDIMTLNLYLRTAQRVLWPFFQDTRCRNLKDLYDLGMNAPWEEILDPDKPFLVNSVTLNNDSIVDTRMPTLKLKDAIVDRMRNKFGRRPSVADAVPVKVTMGEEEILSTHIPLRRVQIALEEALGDWMSKKPADLERIQTLITVDGYILMEGELPIRKITPDTLATRLKNQLGSRMEEQPATAAVFLYWDGDHVKCYIDTSGVTLSRRGYRVNSWKAPMQESLAAACLLASGWNTKQPMAVPFCGSGTVAIEAALIARRVAPGHFRTHFGFMSLKGWTNIIPGESAGTTVRHRFGATPEEIWKQLKQQARDAEIKDPAALPKIVACDIESDAIDQAQSNAMLAGVGDLIKFETCDFESMTRPASTAGTLFLNPPYGERLEDDEALLPVYERIGAWLKTWPGWNAWMITSSKPLSLQVKLKTSHIIPLWNGPIECRLFGYEVY